MPLILGANSVSGGYEVTNSLRFNRGSSDSLTRTPASAGNRKTFTFSCWFKLSNIASSVSGYYQIFGGYTGTVNDGIWISDADKFYVYFDGAERRITNQVIRDVSAWYHLIFAVDTTQATASNRIKLYLNGSEITSFSTNTNPSLNYDSGVNNNTLQNIGKRISDDYFNGYMSEVYLIDGQQLTPSSFGETDEDTNIWKPIPYTGTFGTNGFYLEFKDSSALGDDTSGNGNDFTVNNLTSIDQTTDTPTNNFCTLNPLDLAGTVVGTMTEGNLQVVNTSNANDFSGRGTIAINKGKWYWEVKCISSSGGFDNYTVGIDNVDSKITTGTQYIGYTSTSYAYEANGGQKVNNNSFTAYGSSLTAGDIFNIALDLDNGFIYFGKNGTWQNSGVPTSGANGTGNAFSSLSGTFTPAFSDTGAVTLCTMAINFGNPPFTISSGNADGAGFGNFEYAVPSGYFALCTKNLAQYG
jgi:hypothetical protein